MTAAHEPDDRIPMTCHDCRREFLALAEWQIRCRRCYAAYKAATRAPETTALEAEIARLRWELEEARAEAERWRRLATAKAKPPRVKAKPAIPAKQWRRLIQLAHPDKHSGSPAATEATRWLLEQRP